VPRLPAGRPLALILGDKEQREVVCVGAQRQKSQGASRARESVRPESVTHL